MLRYEVTFRDTMLSYLYNHYIFRRNCPIHLANYKIYKEVESTELKNDRISERISRFKNETKKQEFISEHPFIQIDKNKRIVFRRMSKLLNRNREFILNTSLDIDDYNSKTPSHNSFDPRALFSRALFSKCASFFKSFIKEFEVTEKPSECIVRERIDAYNTTHYYKIPKNEMIKFYALLQKYSYEEIKKKGLYSKASFYRYKNRFEKIGVTKNNIMVVDFINASTDLSIYHSHIIYGKPLISNLHGAHW